MKRNEVATSEGAHGGADQKPSKESNRTVRTIIPCGAADGDYTLVSCTGQIVTTYQGESRVWSVSDHPYRALNDGGEWLMCGYGQ